MTYKNTKDETAYSDRSHSDRHPCRSPRIKGFSKECPKIQFRSNATIEYIEWKYENQSSWTPLISYQEIIEHPLAIALVPFAERLTNIETVNTNQAQAIEDLISLLNTTVENLNGTVINVGNNSDAITDLVQELADLAAEVDAFESTPAGGTTGQVLAKVDDTDYNVAWIDPPESGVPAEVSVVNWDPVTKASEATLSGSDLITTFDGTSTGNVRTNVSRNRGKYYFEVKYDSGSTSGSCGIGLLTAADTAGLEIGYDSDDNSIGIFQNSGNIYVGNTSLAATGDSFDTVGDLVQVAVDLDTNKAWFRVNTGDWNGSATADPVVGTEGISLVGSLGVDVFAAVSSAASSVFSGYFTSLDQTYSAPEGYEAWEVNPPEEPVVIIEYYDISYSSPITGDGVKLVNYIPGVELLLPEDCAGSTATADTAATAETVFSMQKNGVEVATITFAAASDTGTFSTQAAVTYSDTDKFTLVGPTTADATLADVGIMIRTEVV